MFNFQALIKYLLEGMAVALAAFFIPQRKVEVKEIVLIALTAAAVFAILDQFTPSIGASARQGAGFGIGLNQVGWGSNDNLYGGENAKLGPDKVACTCEVDADTLRQRVCPIHSGVAAPASPPSQSSTSETNSTQESVTRELFHGDVDDEPAPKQTQTQTPTPTMDNNDPSRAVEAFDGFMRHF